MLLYYDPLFLLHDTGNHPENAGRLKLLEKRLAEQSQDGPAAWRECRRPSWEAAGVEELTSVHTADYVDSVRRTAESGGGRLDPDTVVSKRSYEVAVRAAGATIDAARRVAGGEDSKALCLVRPPGHHALADKAMGFCLFNNVALAARIAIDRCGIRRVLIVDWDVHHGNGTQAIFWRDADVGFLSMHRFPFYPGTGSSQEIGEGPGRGTTRNLPITFGTPAEKQLEIFQRELDEFAELIRPQLLIISAGFDSHRDDPIGSLGLEEQHFGRLTTFVRECADRHADGRIVSVLEGGYHPQALAASLDEHLSALTA